MHGSGRPDHSNRPPYYSSSPSPTWDSDNDFFGPAVYVFLAMITSFTIMIIYYELQRRKYTSLIDRGYFFVEQFVSFRRKQWVPVPPENVDTSNALYPRIINPALVQPPQNTCCC